MKIYISATYRDLQRHRQAASAVLRRMGHQVIGMEDYVAEGLRPLQRCLADVAECDVLVGLVAWRYGYVPKGDLPPAVALPEGTVLGETSITEFELRQALGLGKTVLMFLLDPEAEWPSSQFDVISGDGQQGKAITRLRQELGEQHLVSYFRTADELAGLVSAAVYREEMNRQMKWQSLEIEATFNQLHISQGSAGPIELTTLDNIIHTITSAKEFQALKINIGDGLDWWMTRLYFLASLAADLRGTEVIVFVSDRAADTFVGTAHPSVVKERLAQSNPAIAGYEVDLSQDLRPVSDVPGEVRRRADVWNAYWARIGGEPQQPIHVTERELMHWLGPYLLRGAIDVQDDDNMALQTQRLLDWPMRIVPVVKNKRFDRIVDKQALAEQVARLFIREQVARALSTIR